MARAPQPQQPAPTPERLAIRSAVTAMLRWRLRALPAAVLPRAARAARLVPCLLHGSFPGTRLRGDAPGVQGVRYGRGWRTLAAEFALPPASRAQRGAPLVEAVLAIPRRERLTVAVVTAAGLAPSEETWVAERAAAIPELLAAAGADVLLRVVDGARLAGDDDSHRTVAFGALCAGRLSPASWAALEVAAGIPLPAGSLAALAADATDPVATLALAVVCAAPAPGPLAAATVLLRGGVTARRLADPAELCARWAAACGPHADDLLAALALARPRSAPLPGDADELVSLGGRLALAAARALRLHRRRSPALSRVWGDAVGPGIPRALLPELGARLSAGVPLRTGLSPAGAGHEVRLPGGALLGRGATPAQARVRSLAVLASAKLDPVIAQTEQPWRTVASRLAQPRTVRTLLLAVEPAAPSGPPHDPLNRGPGRVIGFSGALAIRLLPSGRASGAVLTGEETVERVVREAASGSAVEIVAARGEAHPVAARLQGVAARVRDTVPGAAVAIEAGGRVLVIRDGRIRRFALDRFAARPRVFAPDPEAPDLSLAPGERRPLGLVGRSVIECRAALADERRAAVVYTDAAGGHLRELVALGELEDHLRDARALLQAADPAAILALRLSDDVEPALRRVARVAAPVSLAVGGALPFGLQISLGGDRFGVGTGRSWREGARAALAWWPRDGVARLGVQAVTTTIGPRRASGLVVLWVRSFVLRRMRAHLLHELRAYQPAPARRRTV